MKGYILDYINENEFKKLERALKKYNMLAFKKLMFEYYPSLRNGNFVGELISKNKNKETETYELKLPSDKMFAKIHGDVKLIYTVHKKDSKVVLENITPSEILLEGHRSELTTYKGIMISKKNASKEMFKIDLLSKIQDKMMLIIAIATLLVLITGATYAYFIAQGGASSSKDVEVKTATTDSLVFNAGDPISIVANTDNFGETNTNRVGTTFASAELKANNATNSAKDHYYVYLDILKNEFIYTTEDKKGELILNVTDNNDNEVTLTNLNKVNVVDNKGNTISGYDITEAIGALTLIDKDIETTSTTFEKWNIKITFVNLNSDQNDNTGKSFNAELKIGKEKLNPTLANYIINSFTTQGANNLYHHDGTLENGIDDGSYRYSGAYESVNNWVCFGSNEETCPQNNLYRIIGVFNEKVINADGTDSGKTEERVKLIMNDYPGESVLGKTPDEASAFRDIHYTGPGLPDYDVAGYYWNDSSSNILNNWEDSTFNTETINGTYLTKLGSAWVNKIATTKWKISGNTSSNIYEVKAATAYQNEVINYYLDVHGNIISGYEPVNAKVGLMYVSDYGFTASPANWANTLGYYYNDTNRNNNWLFRGINEWVITPERWSGSVFQVGGSGNVSYDGAYNAYAVRPVFYLESSVKYSSGTGTQTDPIRIN